MSKTFDEGGAKGLLLANLGVSNQADVGGCKIVFDSTLDDDASDETKEPQLQEPSSMNEPTSVDVSSLVAKLDSIFLSTAQTIHDLPLVPQLALLRHEFASLEQEGFVDNKIVSVSKNLSTISDTTLLFS